MERWPSAGILGFSLSVLPGGHDPLDLVNRLPSVYQRLPQQVVGMQLLILVPVMRDDSKDVRMQSARTVWSKLSLQFASKETEKTLKSYRERIRQLEELILDEDDDGSLRKRLEYADKYVEN